MDQRRVPELITGVHQIAGTLLPQVGHRPHGIHPVVHAGGKEGRESELGLGLHEVHVPPGEEKVPNRRIALVDGEDERRVAVVVLNIDVGAGAQ